MSDDYLDEIEDYGRHDLEDLDDSEGGSGIQLWLIAAGLVVVTILAGLIIFDGLEAETYFYSVDEAVAQGPDLVGKAVRIKGQVVAGTIEGEPGQLERKFHVSEKGKTMAISYRGVLPDTFEEDVEVVAEGTVNANFELEADEVLVKCPSRYEGGPSSHPDEIPKSGAQASR